ncbi:serine/threonine-protein kinase [Deinococcus sedimenti]|uniref:serine/threonine-protein kinase n=1 Tax=Deinococcus sedimenti TaxID=1867090 RepID=UPI001E514179|nr:serine/threonine-protein kinase [Deinococcus sedimenti]
MTDVPDLTTSTPPDLTDWQLLSERGGVRCESARWAGRPVFAKTLVFDRPDSRARFEHEGRVAASVRHRLVVSPLRCFHDTLIYPFVPGVTLRERLDTGALGADEATEVAGGVLAAVAALHACGVTHQDLKPENVILAGGDATFAAVRVIDFGMSHSARLPLDIHQGTRMGTPHFMAPEQFLGVRGDPRSDLYSVGVLLFDCLAGAPPFEDAFGWLSGLNECRAPLPGPAELHDVLTRCLTRDRAQRPASAPALYADVSAAREAMGLEALPDLTAWAGECR